MNWFPGVHSLLLKQIRTLWAESNSPEVHNVQTFCESRLSMAFIFCGMCLHDSQVY